MRACRLELLMLLWKAGGGSSYLRPVNKLAKRERLA